MRRTLSRASALLLMALAGTVAAAWSTPYTYHYEMATCPSGANPGMCIGAQTCTAGSCTGVAPTTGPSDGMVLVGVASYRLRTCAASGQTLSGAGTLQAYWFDSAEGLWMRNPGLDQSVTATGKQCQVFPDFIVGPMVGNVRFVAAAVTVSAGAGLDVLLDGFTPVN